MILQNDVLWVGTGSGSIALVDLNTKQPITITNRYTSAVRSLMYISCQGEVISSFQWSTQEYLKEGDCSILIDEEECPKTTAS